MLPVTRNRLLGLALLAPSLFVPGPEPVLANEHPAIRVSPGSINFGSVAGSRTRRVTVRNSGKSQLEVNAIGLCVGTSSEFSVTPGSVSIAPKGKARIDVGYTPADASTDSGCFELASNDPDRPVVTVPLAGTGRTAEPDPAEDPPNLRLRPSSVAFGEVAVGETATRNVRVRTQGPAAVDGVVITRCFGTSEEFGFQPAVPFEVAPGPGTPVAVSYSPTDETIDTGCLEFGTGLPGQEPVVLALDGTGIAPFDGVDLDIAKFKVRRELRLRQGQRTAVRLWVRNDSDLDEPREATVVGEQNGAVVYSHDLAVEDRPGNRGLTPYRLPGFQPTAVGDILWTATIDDDAADDDTAVAVTRVGPGPPPAPPGGDPSLVDLDIARFRVSATASVGRGDAVRLRAWIRNAGLLDEPRPAILIGMQDGVEVYSEALSVADAPGNSGSTLVRFPAYVPTAHGNILWMLVVNDDDPDVDEALGATRAVP